MTFDFIFSLPFMFLWAFLISCFLTIIGLIISRARAQKTKEPENGRMPYACGEDMISGKFQISVQRFFLYVAYFMIFDIAAFILALSFSVEGIYPVLFSVIMVFNLLTVFPLVRGNRK